MFKIKKTTHPISNCNVCGAINFDRPDASNKKVKNLHDILVGRSTNQQITLCDDCLQELQNKLSIYLNSHKKEKLLALAVLIYTEHCKPMADIAIGDGGKPTKVITIQWDYEEERNRFHFNAYTLFCDKRMNANAAEDFNYFVETGVIPKEGVIE